METLFRHKQLLNEKRKEIRWLSDKEKELCRQLGEQSKQFNEEPLPLPNEIAGFQKRIESLENEKFNRTEIYLTTKEQIMSIVAELNYEPNLDFEKMVLIQEDDKFMVTRQNMKSLQELKDMLEKKLEYIKNEVAELRAKLHTLWEMLDEDLMKNECFLNQHPGHSLETLEGLRKEVKRCEELKRANIKNFVLKYRNELETLWDKCKFTDSDRNSFVYFNNEFYSEDLLTLHDMEVQKVKRFYDENR